MHLRRTAMLVLPIVLAAGCEEMKPRTAAPAPAPAAADAGPNGHRDSHASPGDADWQSTSALGKARDAAVRTKAAAEKYQEDVAKQADEVFKKP